MIISVHLFQEWHLLLISVTLFFFIKYIVSCSIQEAVKGQFWRLRDSQGKPPGLMGWWPSRAVTFMDSHDTGSKQVLKLNIHCCYWKSDRRVSLHCIVGEFVFYTWVIYEEFDLKEFVIVSYLTGSNESKWSGLRHTCLWPTNLLFPWCYLI